MTVRFRGLRPLLRIGVTGAALFLVLRHFDFATVAQALDRKSVVEMLSGVVCLFAAFLASALRWHWILTSFGADAKLLPCLRVNAISLFFNQLLPTSIGGDAYRAVAARTLGVGVQPAIESVVIDRAFALLAQIGLLVVLVPFTTLAPTVTPSSNEGLYVAGIAVGVALLAAAISAGVWQRMPDALRRSIARFRTLVADSSTMFGIVLLSLTTHALVGLSLWWMTPLPLTTKDLIDMLFLSGSIVLVTALPISVGGWGLREGGVVAGLVLLGTDKSEAVSAALLWAFAYVCIALPGAMLWLLGRRSESGKLDAPSTDQVPPV